MHVPENCKFGTVAAVGGVLILSGALFLGFWSDLFDLVLNKQLVLSPTSYSHDLWEVTPIPMYIDFYLFNWTNPQDILDADPEVRRPKLVEMGPYVFKEDRKKVVISWNGNNNTVTFLQNKTWVFQPSLSAGSLDDQVTTLNIPAITAAFAIRKFPGYKYWLNLYMDLYDTKISVTKTAGEFLFDGYSDPLLELADRLPEGILPITIPFDKFGWFYKRNGSASYDGVFNMFTGEGDLSKFGTMGQWNYDNRTTMYDSFCGQVNGSAGEFFLPKPTKDRISLFSPDMCRTLTLTYKEEVEVDGINGYRYWGDVHIFDNLTRRPDNWCFCPSGECPPHGSVDVSSCKWGAPAYISFPHFLNADLSYSRSVDGMKPDEKTHQMYIDLEQRTGIPLQVEASLQINILLQSFPEYTLFKDVPKVYVPIIWFKERARIDDKIGSKIRLTTRIPVAGYILFGGMICIGLSIVVIGALYYLEFSRKRKSEDDLKLVGT